MSFIFGVLLQALSVISPDQCLNRSELEQLVQQENGTAYINIGERVEDGPSRIIYLSSPKSGGSSFTSSDGINFCKASNFKNMSAYKKSSAPTAMLYTGFRSPSAYVNVEVERYIRAGFFPIVSVWNYRQFESNGYFSMLLTDRNAPGGRVKVVNYDEKGASAKMGTLNLFIRSIHASVVSHAAEIVIAKPSIVQPAPKPMWCSQNVAVSADVSMTGQEIDRVLAYTATPKGIQRFTSDYIKKTGGSQATASKALADYRRYMALLRKQNTGKDVAQCL